MSEKDSREPTIGVVIAARNAEAYIGEALDSIVNQSVLPNEVVVIDDGSDDRTAAVVESYMESLGMLTLISNSTAVGISKSRNIANNSVQSEYIAVLDADDLFDPDAISKFTDFIKDHPEVDLIYADTLVFTGSKNDANRRYYPDFSTSTIAIRNTLGRPLIPFKHSSMVYRKLAIKELNGYSERFKIKVDIELFLRFQAKGMEVRHLDYATSYHRKHDSQVSVKRLTGMSVYMDLIRMYEPVLWMRYFLIGVRIPSEFLKFLVKG